MKRLVCMFAFCLAGMVAMAQSTRTIKGAVVDSNGNPLPGASIEATGGAESTTVDADGTFTLEVPRWLKSATAKYAGMKPKKVKVTDGDMLFRMKPKEDQRWYVNAVGAMAGGYHLNSTFGFGVMAGRYGSWGYYLKATWVLNDNYSLEPAVPAVTIGASKHIFKFIHVYAGAGYSKLNEGRPYIDDSYYVDYNYDAFAFDLGVLLTPLKHVTVNAGFMLVTDFDYFNNQIQLGVGYAF